MEIITDLTTDCCCVRIYIDISLVIAGSKLFDCLIFNVIDYDLVNRRNEQFNGPKLSA